MEKGYYMDVVVVVVVISYTGTGEPASWKQVPFCQEFGGNEDSMKPVGDFLWLIHWFEFPSVLWH